jgi:hypothetical protein
MDTLTSAAEIELDLIARTTATRTAATATTTTSPKRATSPHSAQQQQYSASIGSITHAKRPLEYDDDEVHYYNYLQFVVTVTATQGSYHAATAVAAAIVTAAVLAVVVLVFGTECICSNNV